MEVSYRPAARLVGGQARRLLAMAMMVLTVFLALPAVPVIAGENGDVLQLSLVASQTDLSAGDEVTLTLTGKNRGGEKIDRATYCVELPSGLQLVDGYAAEGDLGSMDIGAEASVQLKAKVVATAPTMEAAQDTAGSQQDLAKSVNSGTPAAGDQTTTWALLVVAFVGAMVLAIALKRRKAILGLAVVLALAGSVGVTQAQAVETNWSGADASTTYDVKLCGQTATVKATVSYTLANSETAPDDVLTRGDWLAMLLSKTNATANAAVETPFTDIAGDKNEASIKMAYALGLLSDTGTEFAPSAVATRDFVFSTAVLRAGFVDDGAKLAASDSGQADHQALLAIALDVGLAQLDIDNNIRPRDAFAAKDADALLTKVNSLMSEDAQVEDHCSVVYRDDVTVIKGFEVLGDEYSFVADAVIKAGDRVALLPAEGRVESVAGVVLSSRVDGEKTAVTLKFAENLEDIYSSIDISASSVAASLQYAEFADGVEIVDEPTATSFGDGKLEFPKLKFKIDLGKRMQSIKGSVGLSYAPYAKADIKWSALDGFKKLNVGLGAASSYDVGITATGINQEAKFSFCKVPFEVAPGISIWLNLNLEVSLTGEVSLTATLDSYTDVSYSKTNGHLRVESSFDPGVSISPLSAELKGGLAPGVVLKCLGIEAFDLKMSVGAAIKAGRTIRDTGLDCTDLAEYMYCDFSAGEETPWMKSAHLSLSYSLLDEDNSPYKAKVHYENGEMVAECTYGKDKGDDGAAVDDEFEDDGSCYHEFHAGESEYDSLDRQPSFDKSFLLCAGESLIVDAVDGDVFIAGPLSESPLADYGGDTLFRIKMYDRSTGELKETFVISPGGRALLVDKGTRAVIEILCGKQDFFHISQGGSESTLSKGTCETITYPLRVSKTKLKLKVGEKATLSFKSDISALYGSSASDVKLSYGIWDHWLHHVKLVMQDSQTYEIEALAQGRDFIVIEEKTTEIVRWCDVTVEE